jgi:integrase
MKRTRYQYGRVEPSPRANGPNVWVYRWREPNPDGKGRRKSAIVGTVEEYPTQAHALRAAEHMRLAANPDNPNGRLISFGALIDRYIAEEMPQRFSTQAAYRTYLGRYIKPKWAQYSISTVKPFAVRAWLKNLPLAPKSQAHIRNLMSVLFNCAMLWDLIEVQVNPMKLVKILGATKRQEEPRVLTVEEFNKLLAQIEGEPYRTMVVLAMCLGLRCSELIGLQWRDLDWENLTLLVRRAVVASHVDQVKTRYSKKNLPLDPGLADILLSWHRQTRYSSQEDWVFASPFMDGRLPYRSWGIQQRHLRPGGIKAGLGPIGWHDLRHTYRTLLDETGAPISVQHALMRHADIGTTMNVYGDSVVESQRKANSKVVSLLLSKKTV